MTKHDHELIHEIPISCIMAEFVTFMFSLNTQNERKCSDTQIYVGVALSIFLNLETLTCMLFDNF